MNTATPATPTHIIVTISAGRQPVLSPVAGGSAVEPVDGTSVVTAGAPVVSTGDAVVSTGAAVVSAGATVVSAGSAVVSAGAAVVSAGTVVSDTAVAVLTSTYVLKCVVVNVTYLPFADADAFMSTG